MAQAASGDYCFQLVERRSVPDLQAVRLIAYRQA